MHGSPPKAPFAHLKLGVNPTGDYQFDALTASTNASQNDLFISSQMAGRPIYRPAELKALTTKRLYGNGSSQYNRLKLRAADYPELEHDIDWRELAQTAGYGTVHLGTTTVRALREYSERSHRARRINHRFGEGASPRLRQIREAMDALGIDSGSVL